MAGRPTADDEALVPPADLSRFWANVGEPDPVTGCREWTGTTTETGYGVISYGDRRITAHRLAYAVEHGEVPQGVWVLHHCDNPPCTEGSHLYPGDHDNNMADKVARRRGYGRKHWAAKLTAEQVREIRRRWHDGEQVRKLAEEYRLTPGAVSALLYGRTWRHEPQPTGPRQTDNQVRGEQVARAVVTAQQVREMRDLHAAGGWSYAALGARFGISKSGVKAIIRRETWRHVA